MKQANVPTKYICCFCKKEFEDEGFDPTGAKDINGNELFYNPGDKCCKFCHWDYVEQPKRLQEANDFYGQN